MLGTADSTEVVGPRMPAQAPTVLDWAPTRPDPNLSGRPRPVPVSPPPPGFGRWPWWTPMVALAIALALMAGPVLLLDSVEFPFQASVGEGLFGLILVGVAWLFMSRFGGRPRGRGDLGLRGTPSRAAVGWVVTARMTCVALTAIYIAVVGHVTSNAPVSPIGSVDTLDTVDIVIAVVVLAPFFEELFFRGFMYASLRGKLSVTWAALIGGSLFAAIHPLYGATSWNLVPVLALGGVAMCLLYEKTGSLWPPIAFHFWMNVGIIALITGDSTLTLSLVGGLGLLFLIAPWRFFGRKPISARVLAATPPPAGPPASRGTAPPPPSPTAVAPPPPPPVTA